MRLGRWTPSWMSWCEETGAELLELCGVGTQVTGTLPISAGDNSERQASEAAVAQMWGASPIPASCGKTQRHRLNRGRDRQANATLHRIVIVRMRFRPNSMSSAARRRARAKRRSSAVSSAMWSGSSTSPLHAAEGTAVDKERFRGDFVAARGGPGEPGPPLPFHHTPPSPNKSGRVAQRSESSISVQDVAGGSSPVP